MASTQNTFDPVKKPAASPIFADPPQQQHQSCSSSSSISLDGTHVIFVDESPSSTILPTMISDMLFHDRARFFNRCLDIMSIGLLITAGVAHALAHTDGALPWLVSHPGVVMFMLMAQLMFVHVISGNVHGGYMAPQTAIGCFVVYSILNGITLAPLYTIYTEGSIVSAFISAAIMFISCSAFGYATKYDLATPGGAAIASLWGVIVAMIVNGMVGSRWVDMAISIVVVLLFVAITAWDAQRIRDLSEQLGRNGDRAHFTGLAVLGATMLYLDFLNMFLHILRLFGSRK